MAARKQPILPIKDSVNRKDSVVQAASKAKIVEKVTR